MAAQPSGTVTFLFTDIEGSTRLLAELGQESYSEALDAHRRLLRGAFERHGGYEVDCEGDAFFIAFQGASEAVAAAAEAQRGLAGHAWPEGHEFRVRMGLHSGEPLLAPPKYVGLDVHRAARVMAAGHGGQVLVSAATAALVGMDRFRDLGEHRLKDLSAPERVYQLGEGDFPPLRSLYRTNLPVPATRFLGRGRELAEARGILLGDDVRLLTLTGAGGSGKTRLAVEVASELLGEFEHGVYFVGLAALGEPGLVFDSAAQALGTKDELASHVGMKRMLLLFDNFEHLTEAAPALGRLLAAAPNLKVLVTSREPLHLAGEHVYPVRPMTERDAVELFTARAVAARADFAGNGELAEVCRALDGLPLAIELAAARVTVLSPAAMLERLQQRLPLLTGGPRDAPERHRTLQATIEWSHELLTPLEQATFARLAVFAGGSSLAAAEAVCEAELDTLASLVDKSLLRHGDERFRMLQTVREYAHEQLERREEAEKLERRHAEYFLTLAEQADAEIRGPEQEPVLERLSAETDNFRAVLGWSLTQDEIELGLRLATVLGSESGFWIRRSHLSEGRKWLRALVDRGDDVPPLNQARGLWTIAELAYWQGDYRSAEPVCEQSLALFRELDDSKGVALSLAILGALATRLHGDHQRASRLGEESVAVARLLGDERVLARALNDLGAMIDEGGQPAEAAVVMEERLALARKSGDQWAIGGSLHNIGVNAGMSGDYARARRMLEEALALYSPRDELHRAYALGNLGWVELFDGNCLRATTALSESIRIFSDLGEKWMLAENLCAFAGVAAAQGQAIRAGRLWGAAEAILEGSPLSLYERAIEERYVRAARTELGEAEWTKELSAGRALTLEDAVAYALEPAPVAAESM
jgi:predicted ATPase/class 3 adenylate cyclase